MKRLLLAVLAFAATAASAAPVVNVSVNPATGVAPYQATLTWSSTGAVSCSASDGWTGSKALSGTQAVTISANTKYALTCTAVDGKITTSWTAPTSNTDGTPYTDNAGYNVYRGASATSLAKVKSVGPAITSIDDTGLASGTYVYAVTTVNASSLESAKSATASATVTGSVTTASATASVQSIPNPPTGLTVINVTAYKMRQNVDSYSFVSIGTVPIGTACNGDHAADGFNVVPRSAVKLASRFDTLPLVVFAKCG
jgi:hypothetical protein